MLTCGQTEGQHAFKRCKIRPIIGPRCPQDSRKLTFQDYVTMAQDGDKVISFTYRPLLPTPQEILLVLISVRG